MNWNPRDQLKEGFPEFWNSALDKTIQNSHFKKEGQSGGTESSERGSVSSRKTDRVHDLRLLPGYWCSWYRSWLWWFYCLSLFETMMFRNSVRDWPRFQLMMYWKVCTNWENVSLINSKPYQNCTTWKFIKRYRCPIIRSWRRWWREAQIRKLRLRNFDARNERIETGAVVASRRGLRGIEKGKRVCYQWKAKGQCSRGDRCSFLHDGHERAKPTPKTAPPSEPPTPRGGSASRKMSLRGRSPSGRTNRQPCKNFLKGFALNYLVTIGSECSIPHWKVEEQPNKKGRIRMVTQVQLLSWKTHDNWVAHVRTSSRRNLHRFYGRAQKILGPNRRVQFARVALRQANIRESKGPSLNKMQVKLPHQRSPYAVKFKDWSQEETERQERCARGDAWRLAKNICKLKEKEQNCILFAYRWVECACRIHKKPGGKRVCGGLRNLQAYGQQERPWRCRLGNREGLQKSDNGGNSQRRGANKRRGNSVCQRIGFIRDSNASWRYTGSYLTRKTRAKITGRTTIGPVVRNHISSNMAERSIPWSIDKLFKLSYAFISNIFIAGNRNSHGASRINKKWEYDWGSTRKLVAWTSRNRKPK